MLLLLLFAIATATDQLRKNSFLQCYITHSISIFSTAINMVFPHHIEGFNMGYPSSLHKHMNGIWTVQIQFTQRITEGDYPSCSFPEESVQEDVVTLIESIKHSDQLSFVSNRVFFGNVFPQGRPAIACIFLNKATRLKILVWVNHQSYYKSTVTWDSLRLISLIQEENQKKQSKARSQDTNWSIFKKWLWGEKFCLISDSVFLSQILPDSIFFFFLNHIEKNLGSSYCSVPLAEKSWSRNQNSATYVEILAIIISLFGYIMHMLIHRTVSL